MTEEKDDFDGTDKGLGFRILTITKALNYLNHFWNEIFTYLQDGNLSIDNNLTEWTIRKLTTRRNNSYHDGSDAGAEIAAVYHSVISTVKLHGSFVWNFIEVFFKKTLTDAEIMQVWFRQESLWLQPMLIFKTNF